MGDHTRNSRAAIFFWWEKRWKWKFRLSTTFFLALSEAKLLGSYWPIWSLWLVNATLLKSIESNIEHWTLNIIHHTSYIIIPSHHTSYIIHHINTSSVLTTIIQPPLHHTTTTPPYNHHSTIYPPLQIKNFHLLISKFSISPQPNPTLYIHIHNRSVARSPPVSQESYRYILHLNT